MVLRTSLWIDGWYDRGTDVHSNDHAAVEVLLQDKRLQASCHKYQDSVQVSMPVGLSFILGKPYHQPSQNKKQCRVNHTLLEVGLSTPTKIYLQYYVYVYPILGLITAASCRWQTHFKSWGPAKARRSCPILKKKAERSIFQNVFASAHIRDGPLLPLFLVEDASLVIRITWPSSSWEWLESFWNLFWIPKKFFNSSFWGGVGESSSLSSVPSSSLACWWLLYT